MKKLLIVSLILAIALCSQQSTLNLYKFWKNSYNKMYQTGEEEIYRYTVFVQNLKRIKQLQAEDSFATYAPTQFADLTLEEFQEIYLNKVLGDDKCKLLNFFHKSNKFNDPPEAFDWQQKGAVNEPRNQGSCGSCWTFSTVATLEGQTKIKHEQLLELSEQQLVDCDKYNHGCRGGFMSDAFKWLMEHGGIMSRKDYPYKGREETCKFVEDKAVVKVESYTDIEHGNETQMVDALYTKGPLAIGLNANPLQFYSGGILNPKSCSKDGINHGVSGVGYGVEKDVKFWRIKNSWGATWGEKGFFRILRGENKCGLAECSSYVQIK